MHVLTFLYLLFSFSFPSLFYLFNFLPFLYLPLSTLLHLLFSLSFLYLLFAFLSFLTFHFLNFLCFPYSSLSCFFFRLRQTKINLTCLPLPFFSCHLQLSNAFPSSLLTFSLHSFSFHFTLHSYPIIFFPATFPSLGLHFISLQCLSHLYLTYLSFPHHHSLLFLSLPVPSPLSIPYHCTFPSITLDSLYVNTTFNTTFLR